MLNGAIRMLFRRHFREEAPRQGVIDIPVDHIDDGRPQALR
jgi:hypothetical protein